MMKYQFLPESGNAGSLTPQARAIIMFLLTMAIGYENGILAENDIERLLTDMTVPGLVTRQSPYRIFRYYLPTLVKAGFIRIVKP